MHEIFCFSHSCPFPASLFFFIPYIGLIFFSGGLCFCLLSHAPLGLCLFDLLWIRFAFNCTEGARPSPLAEGDNWTLILTDCSLADQPCFVFCKCFVASQKTGWIMKIVMKVLYRRVTMACLLFWWRYSIDVWQWLGYCCDEGTLKTCDNDLFIGVMKVL